MRRGAALFLLTFAVYNANFRRVGAHDTWSNAFLPFCIVLDGALTLDCVAPHFYADPHFSDQWIEKRGEHYYATYAIAFPVLISPLYLPFRLAGPWTPAEIVDAAWQYEKILASLVASLAAVALWRLLRRVANPAWAWRMALAFAFGTSLWATASQALWLHAPAILALSMSLAMLADGRTGRSGFWAGLAMAVRPLAGTMAVAGVLSLAMRRDWRGAARFAAGAAAGVAPLAIYNLAVFGRPLVGPLLAEKSFVAPWWEAVAGVFISPSRGMFVFAPFLLVALWGLRSRLGSTVTAAAAIQVALHVAVLSAWTWWGGHSYGPRLMLDTLPAFAVFCGQACSALEASAWARRVFWTAVAWSMAVQWVGAFCYPNGWWDDRPVPVDRAHHRVWAARDSQIERTARAGPLWPRGWRIRTDP